MKTPTYKYLNPTKLKSINTQTLGSQAKEWYQQALTNPIAKNSAIFYGNGGTGKSALVYSLAKELNRPLFTCYGNNGGLEQSYPDKLAGLTAKDKFKNLITEIETGFYDGIKTNAENGYILLIEWAERTGEWNFLQEASKFFMKDANKKALCIFLTDLKDSKALEAIPYLYKSNLQEIFFSFQLPLIKTLLEQEGIKLPTNFPKVWYDTKSIDLIWNFTYFTIKDFAKFWKENDLSEELENQLINHLESFWKTQDYHWFINDYKFDSEKKRLERTIKSLQTENSQNKADILFLFSKFGEFQKLNKEK
ncbi:MAG: ATP-binding protein [Spiroplasmataceae bacterium]|nr:ATP-binding protein [Spiroplasmataceae bacterium]